MTESDIARHQAKVAQGRKHASKAPVRVQLPKSRSEGSQTPLSAQNSPSSRQPHQKYRNQPCVVDGHKFASKHEAREYAKLRLRQHGGQIEDLQLQVRFPLHLNGVQVAVYVSDFCYQENGQLVVADAKGVKTPIYKLKKKMMAAEYGITILEL